jgi:hypothetical protein
MLNARMGHASKVTGLRFNHGREFPASELRKRLGTVYAIEIRMTDTSSQSNCQAVSALTVDICNAFDGVKRDGGISWRECEAIDEGSSEEECEQARNLDKDMHWAELVDDPKWQPFPGAGGFPFIDEIGFRYYLAPTMIRFVRGEITEYYPGHLLGSIDRFVAAGDPAWTPAQLEAIARFILFMAANDPEGDGRRTWETALKTRWIQYLPVFHSPYK